jgi:hypothetical protein
MDQRPVATRRAPTERHFLGASYDLPGAVEDILQVAPATTNIVVVIGATPLEQFWTDVLRREYQPFTNRVSFTWFNDLSFDQMLQRSAKLPPRSFMLLHPVDAGCGGCDSQCGTRRSDRSIKSRMRR